MANFKIISVITVASIVLLFINIKSKNKIDTSPNIPRTLQTSNSNSNDTCSAINTTQYFPTITPGINDNINYYLANLTNSSGSVYLALSRLFYQVSFQIH